MQLRFEKRLNRRRFMVDGGHAHGLGRYIAKQGLQRADIAFGQHIVKPDNDCRTQRIKAER